MSRLATGAEGYEWAQDRVEASKANDKYKRELLNDTTIKREKDTDADYR